MTRIFAEKLAPNADLKTVLATCAREVAEDTRSTVCQIRLNNPFDPADSVIYEFRAAPEADSEAEKYKFILPLMNQGELLGTITIAGLRPQDSEEVGRLSAAFVELAARINKAQSADVVQRQTFHKTFLTEIDNVMSYSPGVGDALFVIVNILGKVLGVSRCIFVCTDDAQTGWKSYEYWMHDQVRSCKSYGWPTTDSPLVAQTLFAKQPLVIYAAAAGTFLTPVQQELQHLGVQSFLGIPLKNENGVHGCVVVQQCDFRRRWKPADIGMLQAAADTVSKGFLNVSPEKFARQPIMHQHQQNVDSYQDQKEGQRKVEAVRRALRNARAQGDTVSSVVMEPTEPAPRIEEAVPPLVTTTDTTQIAEDQQPEANKQPEANDRPHAKIAPKVKSENVQTKWVLSKEDEEYIFATTGLDTRTLKRIAGWVNQIEANDKYANGHAVPVAKYATATAQQLGLQANEIQTVRMAALVHDVGKIGISDRILKKEDEDLNDAELLISMKHPQDGAELLESFPDLAHVASIVRAHHEEYDGNGFPAGLKGEDIPLEARILFVVNAYHVMISPRKSGFAPTPAQTAQENLRQGAGSQYDPRVVEALLRVLKQS